MTDYPILVEKCMVRPVWLMMARAYNDYYQDHGPCKARATGVGTDDEDLYFENQCAVRMSVALERCGISFNSFGRYGIYGNAQRVHRNPRRCRLNIPHLLGATDVARYLKAIWGTTREFPGRAVADAPGQLAGQRGIVYFSNCYPRANGGGGDHVDLWDGNDFWNIKLGISAGGGLGPDAPLFHRSDQVWFFALR